MSTDRHKGLVAAVILGAIPTLLFIDILTGWNALYSRDIVSYYYPAKTLLREIVLNGEFPYWNPWFSAGQPLAANPEHEVFYPLTWLILLPSFDFGFQLLPIVHVYIAVFGTYALLRDLAIGRTAAVIGALTFGIGGMTISTINLFPILFSLAWLPLTCLFARRFMNERSLRAFAPAAGFLGLQLLVGEPVTALQSGLLLGAYGIGRGWSEGAMPGAMRRVADVAAIAAGALAISAVQTLPAYDHLGDSVRSRGFEFAIVSQWSTPWQRVAEFVYPHVFGLSLPDSGIPYWGGPMYGTANAPFFFSVYYGLAVAVLCGAGLLARIRGHALFAVIAGVSLLLAFGSHTPLLGLLHDAGVFRSFRYPEKFLMMGGFAAVVFASSGLDAILSGARRMRSVAAMVAGVAAATAAVGAVIARTPLYPAIVGVFVGSPLRPTSAMLAQARTSWIIAAAIAAGLLILLRNTASSSRRGWRIAFLALLLVDLAPLALEIAPRVPASFYRQTPRVVTQLPKNREPFRLFHYAEWSVRSATGNRYRYNHPDRYRMIWNGISPMLPAAWQIRTVLEEDFDKTALLPSDDFREAVLELGTRNWIDVAASMSNIGYLAVWADPEEALARAHGVMRDVQPVRIVGPADNPRYYFATRLVQITGREDFVRKLRAGSYPRHTAFIEQPEFPAARGVVRTVAEKANSASLEVEAEGVSFLVMSVTPHKYWDITIDGRPARSIITNIGYQGVVIPPGRHTVVMRYRNPLIVTGAAISIITLIALCAMLLCPRKYRQR